MSVEQWTSFWTIVLVAGCGGFAVLAVVVAIGGFRDVKAMFRRIDAEHAEAQDRHLAGEPRSSADPSRR